MAPGAMLGSSAQGMTKVKLALEALMSALPTLPMGSELQKAALKAVTDLSKHFEQGAGGDSASQIQQLIAMAREAKAQPQQQAMMRMFPGAAAAGGEASPPGAGAPPPGAA